MKLTRLDLDRYGPFTGKVLDFRPGADLHIVYGPNEAGKSSALAAITDLLYGFEPRSPANFRHRYEDLRIGADMVRADGETLRLWRRKRLRNSLTDVQDVVLDDGLLEPILGGISREVFQAAFGLDQTGLRDGARQMLAAQGEVGESLFAAASGLRTLISVRAGLDGEADGLFGARKSAKRAFYEAQERYDAARKALREHSLRADDVRDLDEGIAAQETHAGGLAERLKEAGARRSRVDRVRRVAPLLARIERSQRELADQVPAAVPDLRPGFADEIEAALGWAEAGRETLARLAREVAQAEGALKAIVVDESFLAAGEAIMALNDQRAVNVEAQHDLPRREDEAEAIGVVLDDHARRLGLPDRAALARLQPSDLTLSRIRDLAERRRSAEVAAVKNEEAAQRAHDAIGGLTEQAAGLAPGGDPEPLRRRLQAMRPALAAASAIGEREADLARRKGLFEERLARLSPRPARPQALWSWAEPAPEVLARFEQRFAEHLDAARQDEAEGLRLKAAIAASDQAVAPSGGDDELVDSAVLDRERDDRDSLFEAVLAEPKLAAVNAYRKAVRHADALADRRLSQAERLARRAVAVRTRQEAAAGLEALSDRKAARGLEEVQTQAEWRALFEALGCEAGMPGEMRRFLAEAERLREERAALLALESQLDQLRRGLAEERPALEAMAAEAGLSGVASQSLTSLIRLLEDQLDALEQGARKARSLTDQIAAGRRELARARREADEAHAALDDTQADWVEAVGQLGLGAKTSTHEAIKASDLWSTVQGQLGQLESLDHRIARMKENREGFASRARTLAEALMPEAAGEDAVSDEAMAVTAALVAGLTKAREAATRRRAATEALARQRDGLGQAQHAQRQGDAAIAALAEEAGCEAAGLASLAAALKARAGLRDELARARAELDVQSDGLGETVLAEEVADIGTDRAAGESAAVQAELEALAEEDKQAALTLGELRRRREAIEREAGAAGAAQSLQDARSDLERIARDYLVLKAASLMIEAGLERQLKTEQGPLIARAGALFSTMTGGSFVGIATLYDDDDRLRLAARRPDGNTTAIEGLSEGTRDQLYLALRLANLEAMAARREVPPFIGDDLVITFDERRVAAALQVLAVNGSPLQKILFTHHRHVVEIAQDRLGHAVDVIMLENGL